MKCTGLSLMILIVLEQPAERFGYEQFLLQTVLSNCPYLATCTKSHGKPFPNNIIHKYMPCCQECSCKESCLETENCCSDVELPNVKQQGPTAKCISAAFPESERYTNGYNTIFKRYTAIDSCPRKYKNKTAVRLCTTSTPTAFEQVLYVSDHNTIYRNIYCAMCNGIEHTQDWFLAVRCPYLPPSDKLFEMNISDILDRKCTLLSVMPTHLQALEDRTCFIPDISTCNVTGYWNNYNEPVAKACATETGVYFSNGLVYKNIFCFLCNKNAIQENECKLYGVESKFSIEPFFGLLAPGVLKRHHEPHLLHGPCSTREIYDTHFRSCRKLTCPPDSAATNGKCEKNFVATSGIPVNLFLRMYTQAELQETSIDGKNLMQTVFDPIVNRFILKGCRSCRVSARLEQLNPVVEFSVGLPIINSATCPTDTILKIADSLDNSFVNITTNGKALSVHLNLIRDEVINLDDHNQSNSATMTKKFYGTHCPFLGFSFSAFDCPKIQISGYEYMILLDLGLITNVKFLQKYSLDALNEVGLKNVTLDICLDDYYPTSDTVHVSALCKHYLSQAIAILLLRSFSQNF